MDDIWASSVPNQECLWLLLNDHVYANMSEGHSLLEVKLLARITELEAELERERTISTQKDEQLQTWLLTVETTLQQTLQAKDDEVAQLRADVDYYKALASPHEYIERRIALSVSPTAPATDVEDYSLTPPARSLSNTYLESTSQSSAYDTTPCAQLTPAVYSMLEQLRRDVSAFSPSSWTPSCLGSADSLFSSSDADTGLTASPPARIPHATLVTSTDEPHLIDQSKLAPSAQTLPVSATISDLVTIFNQLSLTVGKPCTDSTISVAPSIPTINLSSPQPTAVIQRSDPVLERRPVHRRIHALADAEDHLFTPLGSPAASDRRGSESKLGRERMGSPHLRLVVRTPYWREALGCRTPVSPCWGIGKGKRL
ncbi:hypothetical protein PENSPDRAFT_649820 [Peniophora sp. CONT]|nr:hypothetical protein PENSPDRAFT_649820 [Peniophora sp. CONT]